MNDEDTFDPEFVEYHNAEVQVFDKMILREMGGTVDYTISEEWENDFMDHCFDEALSYGNKVKKGEGDPDPIKMHSKLSNHIGDMLLASKEDANKRLQLVHAVKIGLFDMKFFSNLCFFIVILHINDPNCPSLILESKQINLYNKLCPSIINEAEELERKLGRIPGTGRLARRGDIIEL